MPEPRETSAKVHTPCPTCGEYFPDDICIWVWNGKFYCSEGCCRKAATGG